MFAVQTEWVMDDLEIFNIEAVIHVGGLADADSDFAIELDLGGSATRFEQQGQAGEIASGAAARSP